MRAAGQNVKEEKPEEVASEQMMGQGQLTSL